MNDEDTDGTEQPKRVNSRTHPVYADDFIRNDYATTETVVIPTLPPDAPVKERR